MKRSLKIFLAILIVLAATAAYILFRPGESNEPSIANKVIESIDRGPEPEPNPVDPGPGITEMNVPFTSQSPLVNWKDAEEDAACEEANMVMAWHWIQNDPAEKIDPNLATTEIHAIIDYENKTYGNAIDTSAADTAKVFNSFYKPAKAVSVKFNITSDQIIAELQKGNLVIVPTDGVALNNPHFQNPGPQTHMVTIRGYDSNTKEFITNDPGTRFGENYRYSYDILFNAIRDYPTGNHLPITEDVKAMLVVSK